MLMLSARHGRTFHIARLRQRLYERLVEEQSTLTALSALPLITFLGTQNLMPAL